MPSRFERYRVRDGVTVLGERYFNPVFQDVDLRLASLEDIRVSWEAAVQAVSDFGLLRINEVIGPALNQLQDDIGHLQQDSTEIIAALKQAQADLQNAIQDIQPVSFVTYEQRSILRNGTPSDRQMTLVAGLGLFVFEAGSDEPDDDESCFATINGRWLLEAPSWDLIDAWLEAQADADRPIFAHAKCSISSINATASAKFSVLVPGAKVGDVVSVTPPAEIGDGSQNSGRLSFYGFVSAPDTVTIQLSNPSAATAVINPAARADWIISIWKEK